MMKSFTGSPLILSVLERQPHDPTEADVRVMAFCLGKLANFLNKVERFPEIVESNGPLDAVGGPQLAIDSLPVRREVRLLHLLD